MMKYLFTQSTNRRRKIIGIWGQQHKRYLQQYLKATYTMRITRGRQNSYFADIDRQAQERFERLLENMKITEQQLRMVRQNE